MFFINSASNAKSGQNTQKCLKVLILSDNGLHLACLRPLILIISLNMQLLLLLSRCQFHQHFTSSFFVRKALEQLFCTYIVGLNFFGARKLAQKLLVKCWWNWLKVVPPVSFISEFVKVHPRHLLNEKSTEKCSFLIRRFSALTKICISERKRDTVPAA